MKFKFGIVLLLALLCTSVLAQKAKDDDASGWKEFSSAEGNRAARVP